MASIRKSLAALSADLQLFAPQVSSEVTELRRNVEVCPVTGATLYRHCLEDLNDRLASLGEDVESLEAVSLDAISLEELVGHCTTLYEQNARAIAALESRLQSYGYTPAHAPTAPRNPFDLLALGTTQAPEVDTAALPSPGSDALSPVEVPPSLSRYGAPCSQRRPTAADALAPMTAAKARARHDTPSSLSSPELLSPSMRQLLGKYASEGSVSIGGSSGGLSFLPMSRSAQKGTAARPDVPLSPVPPLSPAFAAAAEQHRAQLGAHLPEEEPEAPPMGTPLEGDILAAEALLASTAEKLASNPALLDAYRDKYPFVAASAERLAAGSGGAALAQAPSHQAHYDASWLQPVGGTRQVYEEESTMELKSQIIFNRALPRGGQTHAAATPSVGAAPLATPASAAPMDRAPPPPHPTPASIASGNGPGGNEVRSKESLQEAIAVALGRHAGTAAAPTPQAATPAAALTTQSAGTRGFPSARSARSSLTPSLPSAVPPYRAVGAAEYSTLPAFIRGQLPLEALNQAASGVHSVAVRRCAAGEGASFSMDDVESAGELPAGKGKVLVNALAKLGHVQLKVLYGQGTVYFFS